jgi:hypothetical protein
MAATTLKETIGTNDLKKEFSQGILVVVVK